MFCVTGGTGFLGGVLVEQLLEQGEQVRVIARSGTAGGLQGAEYVRATVTDYEALAASFRGCSGVYHLAGLVEHSRRSPASNSIDSINIDGTLNVLRAAAEAGVPKVVYASTSGTVGVSLDGLSVADDSAPYAREVTAEWPYYRSKIRAEEQAIELAKRLGLDLVCMRPTLMLGPGDSRLSSSRTAWDLLNGKVPFVPKGGLSIVDVRDVATAFRAAMQRAPGGSTFLLGAQNMTLKEYFQMVCDAGNCSCPWLEIPDIAAWSMAATVYGVKGLLGRWDPSYDPVLVEMGQVFWYIDAKAARETLGFSPRDVRVTVADTVRWLHANAKTLHTT